MVVGETHHFRKPPYIPLYTRTQPTPGDSYPVTFYISWMSPNNNPLKSLRPGDPPPALETDPSDEQAAIVGTMGRKQIAVSLGFGGFAFSRFWWFLQILRIFLGFS